MKATHLVDENSEALGGEETPQRHTAAEPKSDLPVTNESFFLHSAVPSPCFINDDLLLSLK